MTALVTLAGLTVLDGLLTLPRSGVWTLEAEIDADEAPTGAVELLVAGDGAPAETFAGVVARGIAPAARARVVVVGGRSGGLSSAERLSVEVPALHYDGDPTPVSARALVEDLAELTGEGLAAGAGEAIEAYTASSWHRIGGSAASALAAVLRRWGLSARFLPSGDLWAGVESWPSSPETPDEVDPVADTRCFYAAPRSARIQPGQVVYGQRIERVQYLFTPRGMRARLYPVRKQS
jgi:hypothetical protein